MRSRSRPRLSARFALAALAALSLASAMLGAAAWPPSRWAPLPLGCAPSGPRAPAAAASDWLEDRTSAATEPRAPAAPTAAPPAVEPVTWELSAQLASFKPATGRARSQHFTGDMEAEVRINAAASPYPLLGPERVLPPGAALVEFHYPASSSEPVTLLAMVKRPAGYDPDGGDWEYVVLTPQGTSTHRGALPLCRRCHADAPHDHLFGGPR